MDSIWALCDNPSEEALERLDSYSSVFLLNACLKIREGELSPIKKLNSQKIVFLVLKYFRIRNFPPVNPVPYIHAEIYSENFAVSFTGARDGDTLVGISNVSRGAVIKIHMDDVLPNRESVLEIRAHEDVYKRALENMRAFDKFQNMGAEEIDNYLVDFCNPKKAFLGEDSKKIRLELIRPGESNFAKHVSQENLEELMSGKLFSLREMEGMFPRKPGSRALHPTLMFIKHWWKIMTDFKMSKSFGGISIDLLSGELIRNFGGGERKSVVILEDLNCISTKTMGFVFGPPPGALDRNFASALAAEMLCIETGEMERIYEKMLTSFKNFSPSYYKSLLQKIIRFRAEKIELSGGELIRSDAALLITLSELILHPGSFVPDIQRFVSGIESATKRLAVAIFEDSAFDREKDSLALLGAALLCQRNKKYKPEGVLLKRWFDISLRALKSPKVNYWEIDRKCGDYQVSEHNNSYGNASALLDEIKSFGSDLNMVSYLASEKVKCTPPEGVDTPLVRFMPVCHSADFHCAPDIAYYFDKNIPCFEGGALRNFYRSIFREVTGVNPRRNYKENFENFEERPAVREVRKAQMRFLITKQAELKWRENEGGKYLMKETLGVGWLAGLVGTIEISDHYVTMRYDDPYSLVVTKKPSRDARDSRISPEEQEEAIAKAKKLLEKGIKLGGSSLPSEDFKNSRVVLDGGEYFIEKNKILTPWEEFRKIKVLAPFHKKLEEEDLYYMGAHWKNLRYKGAGLEKGGFERLKNILGRTEISTLKRALMHISSYSSEFELNHLNTKGEPLHLSVNNEDLRAHHFLLELSGIFPGAFSPCQYSPIKFKVLTPLLFWRVRSRIKNNIKSREVLDNSGWDEYKFEDLRKRVPWEHQTSCLEEMKENHRLGNRGNFVWLKVGSGKTYLALSYMAFLAGKKKLPPHIIYSLPSSAIQSVAEEIKSFGLKINLHVPLKNISKKRGPEGVGIKQNGDFEPFAISMIEHDHLRRVKGELVKISNQSMVVVDEVHKTLNDTQRTSAALEICYLSRQFVAISGTPVIDNRIYKLLAWLKQIVPFELNEKNFWVAVNSMVSRSFSTGIITSHKDILAPFSPAEERKYQRLVGPSAGGLNKNVTGENIREAFGACYRTATAEMVKKINELTKKGRRVMVVAGNRKHQLELYEKLSYKNSIYLIEKNGSIFLTDESVASGKTPAYQIVITTVRQSEGYTLTYLDSFVSSVYFSNQANRDQLEGRINRIGQTAKSLEYYYAHCGILTFVYRKYKDARGLKLSMESMIKEIINKK